MIEHNKKNLDFDFWDNEIKKIVEEHEKAENDFINFMEMKVKIKMEKDNNDKQ